MKNRDVLVLNDHRMISGFLTDGYAAVTKIDGIEAVGKSSFNIFMLRLMSIALLLLSEVFLALGMAAGNTIGSNFTNFCGFMFLAAIGFAVTSIIYGYRDHDFTKSYRALKDILYEEREMDWKRFVDLTREALVEILESVLGYRAALVRYAENTYDIGSVQAKHERERFDYIHAICLRFALVEEKKNKYYDGADKFTIRQVDMARLGQMAPDSPAK